MLYVRGFVAPVLLGGALSLVAACASTPTAQQLAQETARERAALIRQGGAFSLMTAALIEWSRHSRSPGKAIVDPELNSLVQEAVTLAPTDRALAWTSVALCGDIAGCDAKAAAARFRSLDPANAAGWLPDLAAIHDPSDPGVDAVLAKMGRSTTFLMYFNRRVVETADALTRVGAHPGYGIDAAARVSMAAALVAAEPAPGIQVLARACDTRTKGTRERDCDAVLMAMAHGDEVLLQMLAAGIQIRRRGADDTVRASALTVRRTLAWQMQLLPSVEFWPFSPDERASERLRLMKSLPSETEVMEAMLRIHHQRLKPPAGWTPGIAN